MKPKIHFHADNTYWSGAEQMLTCLFSSKVLKDNFEISFSYRFSEQFVTSMVDWWRVAGLERKVLVADELLNLFSSRFYGKWYWPFKYIAFFSDAVRIYKVLKQVQPDIVHIHNGGYPGALSCNAAVAATRFLKKRPQIVYFVNNMPKKRGLVQRIIERPIDVLLDKEVDVFLSGSHAVSNELGKLFSLEDFDYYHLSFETRAKVIPNTIHDQPLGDEDQVRRDLGLKLGDILIVSVGVFEKRKGHIYLIRAFESLRKQFGMKIHLLLVGAGSEAINYVWRRWVQNIHLQNDTLNSYSYINACDIYVQPSIEHEDFPISVLQAMKLGKPIVGTTVAGIMEQIRNGVEGFLVAPKDAGSLEGCLKTLIEKLGLRQQMGRASRERYGKFFFYDKIMAEYVKFYKELLR